MCHMPRKKIFKKVEHFEFFFKMGPRGQKYENFEKLFSDLKKAPKNAYKTCVTLPKRRKNN